MKIFKYAQPIPVDPGEIITDVLPKVKEVGDKAKKFVKEQVTQDNSSGSQLEVYTEYNELANLFKDTFHVIDPRFTDPKQLQEFLNQTPIARDVKKILPLIKSLKDTLLAVSRFKSLEPDIAQLLAKYTIDLMDRTHDPDQVIKKLNDLKDKAFDTQNPKDAYIISMLRGEYGLAQMFLLLSNIGKKVSPDTLKDMQEAASIANKMLGQKSEDLINAQYLDNEIALTNAAMIARSQAQYQALIPWGVQNAKWRRDLNNFAETAYKSPYMNFFLRSPIVSGLGAFLGGRFGEILKLPLNDLFGGN